VETQNPCTVEAIKSTAGRARGKPEKRGINRPFRRNDVAPFRTIHDIGCYRGGQLLSALLATDSSEFSARNWHKSSPGNRSKVQVLPKQLEEWMRRAIGEGKLTKKKKKGRIVYAASSADSEQTLFNRDGDAA
jgi:hypothetical protein